MTSIWTAPLTQPAPNWHMTTHEGPQFRETSLGKRHRHPIPPTLPHHTSAHTFIRWQADEGPKYQLSQRRAFFSFSLSPLQENQRVADVQELKCCKFSIAVLGSIPPELVPPPLTQNTALTLTPQSTWHCKAICPPPPPTRCNVVQFDFFCCLQIGFGFKIYFACNPT